MPDSAFKELKQSNVFKVATVYGLSSGFLLQIGDIILEAFDAPPWVMQGLLWLLVIGFVLVLIFTRLHQSYSKKIKHTYLIISTLIVLISGVSLYQYRTTDEPASSASDIISDTSPQTIGSSIAVLPFVNMSEDKSNEYFSDGISEEILNVLAKIPNLQVAARTSSFQFKGKNKDIQDIAKQLGVKTILEGSIRKAGNKVRITAQLIQADSGFHIWSESYDRELDDIFKVQDEISAAIVKSLKESLGLDIQFVTSAKESINSEVYDLYLQGLQNLRENNFRSLERAKDNFEQALTIDSTYIPIQIGLAETLFAQVNIGSESNEDIIDTALELAKKVLAVDKKSAETYYLLSRIENFNGNRSIAAEYLIQAYQLDSKSSSFITTYAVQVRNPELLEVFNKATIEQIFQDVLIRDPLNHAIHSSWAQIQLALLQDYDAAERSILRAIELYPDDPSIPYRLALFYGSLKGDLVRSLQYISLSSDSDDPDLPITYSRLYLSLGDKNAALDYANLAIKTSPLYANAIRTKAVVLHSLGNSEEALTLINTVLSSEDYFHRSGSKLGLLRLGIYILLNKRDIEGAEKLFYTHYSEFKSIDEPIIIDPSTRNEYQGLDIYAAILIAKGDAESKALISDITINITEETLLKNKSRLESYDYYTLGFISILNNQELSVEYFEKSFENGMLLGWYDSFVIHPLLINLKDNSGYIKLLSRIKKEAARQLTIVNNEKV